MLFSRLCCVMLCLGMLCVALCCVLGMLCVALVVCCMLCTTRTSRYDAFQKNCELELRGSANNCV